ncbi:hypothetical protein Gpo141_00008315 [Globisporangium polare]
MAKFASLVLAAVALLSVTFSTAHATETLTSTTKKQALPIFYFHGVTDNSSTGSNIGANLTAEGRLFTPLTFCQSLCSVLALEQQVPLAIAQIRSIVANDTRYDNGYVFVTHSQGGAIARGVIEEMDDHKVKALVSLAGTVNGAFYATQSEDLVPLYVYTSFLTQLQMPFNFSSYSAADFNGKLQRDISDLAANNAALQSQYSVLNLIRSPYFGQWVKTNPYFPKLNNVNICAAGDSQCVSDKLRRRNNFLKLKEAHFFASSSDDVVAPWQQAILGQYSEVSSSEEIETKFASLKVIDAKHTREYTNDTYGLKTLDKRGGLFLHPVAGVAHSCWLRDYVPNGQTTECKFQPVFNDKLYPVFHKPAFFC